MYFYLCLLCFPVADTPISPSSMSCYSVNHGQIRTHLFERARKKSSRMSAVIVAAFILCWTPYYIIFLGFAFFHWDNSRTVIYFFTLGTSNCMLNPLIYGAFTIYKVHRGRLVFLYFYVCLSIYINECTYISLYIPNITDIHTRTRTITHKYS